jgi:hypothetical protein
MLLGRIAILFFVILAFAAGPGFAGEGACEPKFAHLESVPSATVVKLRKDGTRIFRLVSGDKVSFFRETPMESGAIAEERAIFDDPNMPGLVYQFTRGLGIDEVVPRATYEKSGINISLQGAMIRTRPGAIQDEVKGLTTPIDEWKKLHPGQEPRASDIEKVLNTGQWPRLYANWKILWRLMNQVDLSIENLAEKNGQIAIFDLGDAFNLPASRSRMGIAQDMDNMNFNMPNKAWDRVEFRADFRKADQAFKNLVRVIATENDEATAHRLGMGLDEILPSPRGRIRDHVASIKSEASRLLELLNRDPFSY